MYCTGQVDAETNNVTLMTCHQRRELPPITEEDEEQGGDGHTRDPGQKSAENASQLAASGVNKAPGSARPATACNG